VSVGYQPRSASAAAAFYWWSLFVKLPRLFLYNLQRDAVTCRVKGMGIDCCKPANLQWVRGAVRVATSHVCDPCGTLLFLGTAEERWREFCTAYKQKSPFSLHPCCSSPWFLCTATEGTFMQRAISFLSPWDSNPSADQIPSFHLCGPDSQEMPVHPCCCGITLGCGAFLALPLVLTCEQSSPENLASRICFGLLCFPH